MKPRTLLLCVAVVLLSLLVLRTLCAPEKPVPVAPTPTPEPVSAPAKKPVVTMKGSIVHLENLHANPHFIRN